MSTHNGSTPAPDPARLAQILALQERLLLDEREPGVLGTLVCQRAALSLGAAAARLVALAGDDTIGVVAEYGVRLPFPAYAAADLRRACTEGRPVVDTGGGADAALLTVPVDTGNGPVGLQLLEGEARRFGTDDVALARYAASLAGIALRLAGDRAARGHGATDTDALIVLSHDLRQPLSVLLGYTRLMLENAYGGFTDEQRTILGTLERHAAEMHVLLNGALDLAQRERQDDVDVVEFSFPALLEEVCGGSLVHQVASGVELIWETDPSVDVVRSDRFRVRQIAQNLLDNALRFTSAGSVTIAATRRNGVVELSVTDTGTGMTPADLASVFTPFRPGRDAAPARRGRGCGLYLVKRFAESLGGHVTVASDLGVGTRFVVALPESR